MKNDLGRNDPCHCGSGKKYKQCCLSKDEEAARKARAGEQPAEAAGASGAGTAAEIPHSREHRHQTAQPWKRNQPASRGVPRFTAPRRSGGS
jgi:hypothetical protein